MDQVPPLIQVHYKDCKSSGRVIKCKNQELKIHQPSWNVTNPNNRSYFRKEAILEGLD